MLVAYCFWLLVIPAVFGLGYAANGRLFRSEKRPLSALVGLSIALMVGQAASLVVAVNGMLLLAVLGAGWVLALRERKALIAQWKAVPPWGYGVLIATALGTGMKAAATSTWFDEGLYYLQTIRWIQEYGVVPGLGLLHGRFGFNSIWHVGAALFNPYIPGLGLPSLTKFTELVLLLFSVDVVLLQSQYSKNKVSLPLLALLAGFLFLPKLLGMPAADGGVVLFNLVIAVATWNLLGAQDSALQRASFLQLVLFVAIAVAIKLSSLTVFLLPLAYLAFSKPAEMRRLLLPAALCCTLVLGPWVGRTWYITGYPAYPVKLPLPTPEWAVSDSLIATEQQDVTLFARFGHQYAGTDAAQLARLSQQSIREWLPNSQLMNSAQGQGWLVAWVAMLVGLSVYALIRNRALVPVITYLWAGAALWLLKAPDIRFAWGLMATTLVWVVYLATNARLGSRLLLPVVAAVSLFFVWSCRDFRSLSKPLAVLKPPVVQVKQIPAANGFYFLPTERLDVQTGKAIRLNPGEESPLCWNAPLPCAERRHAIMWRSNDLKDGFKPVPR